MSIFESVLDKHDKLLDRAQAAEYLGLNTHTLNIWACKKKNLPYYKVGRLVKYKLSDLDNFLNKSKQEIKESDNGERDEQ